MSFEKTRPVILIGGPPATGKSTIATNLSKHLGIPWVSTDQFRTFLQYIGDPEKAPALFETGDHTAESYHAKYGAQDIINHDLEQTKEIWPYIKDFIENDWSWTEGFIIEGVNIIPEVIADDLKNMPNLRAVFIIDENAQRTKETIYKRGIWAPADT